MKILIKCIRESWPKNEQVQLYGLSTIHTCLRQNAEICCLHAGSVIDAVIDSIKAYLTGARINLFGCWILYEIAIVPRTMPLLRHVEMIKLVQAVQTRFHDDEILQLATQNVLDLVTKDVEDYKKAKRLGIAEGALS